MVVKQGEGDRHRVVVFESRAVLDGSQTTAAMRFTNPVFESRAVLDGSQTHRLSTPPPHQFESRAVLDGSQTPSPM